MVLVDTSIWIDFFQDDGSFYAKTLEGLIMDNNMVVICGVVLQEILQGIRDNSIYELTKERLYNLTLKLNRYLPRSPIPQTQIFCDFQTH
ncbi:MAG: hypothetical protein Fur0020_02270 [Thermodesulfovibrionia bacterium]